MRIMSEKRFEAELAKAKEEAYRRESMDRRFAEMWERIENVRQSVDELRCKVENQMKARCRNE